MVVVGDDGMSLVRSVNYAMRVCIDMLAVTGHLAVIVEVVVNAVKNSILVGVDRVSLRLLNVISVTNSISVVVLAVEILSRIVTLAVIVCVSAVTGRVANTISVIVSAELDSTAILDFYNIACFYFFVLIVANLDESIKDIVLLSSDVGSFHCQKCAYVLQAASSSAGAPLGFGACCIGLACDGSKTGDQNSVLHHFDL